VAASFSGDLEDVAQPNLPPRCVLAVLAADANDELPPGALPVLQAANLLAAEEGSKAVALFLVPREEDRQRRAVARLLQSWHGDVVLLAGAEASPEVLDRLLQECWPGLPSAPRAVVGEPWTGTAMAALARQAGSQRVVFLRVARLARLNDRVILETSRAGGKLRMGEILPDSSHGTRWIALTAEAEVEAVSTPPGRPRVQRWSPRLERFYRQEDIQQLLADLKQEAGVTRLADAEFIVDVGFGVGNRDGYEAVIEPLEQALRRLGVRGLAVGGSRKVTEELHVLPVDRQIGQSGVRVNPQVLLAIGISGAPQHLDYIGPRAVILAFNRDAEAPIMTLNRRQARPRVFPVVGDLFQTVPALIAALGQEEVRDLHPVG
jgi:hypothetical protein